MEKTAKEVPHGRMATEKDGQEKSRDHSGGNHVVRFGCGARVGSIGKSQISERCGPTTGRVTQVAEEETAKEGMATPEKADGGGP